MKFNFYWCSCNIFLICNSITSVPRLLTAAYTQHTNNMADPVGVAVRGVQMYGVNKKLLFLWNNAGAFTENYWNWVITYTNAGLICFVVLLETDQPKSTTSDFESARYKGQSFGEERYFWLKVTTMYFRSVKG